MCEKRRTLPAPQPKDLAPCSDAPGTAGAYYRQPEIWELGRYERNAEERLRARVVASLIDPDVDSILDVGCGNGFVTRHLRARTRVVGLDPSPEALAAYPGESVLGSGENLPFPDLSFDAVVCCEVLEHLSATSMAKTVSEIQRTARSVVVIGVPYREDLREGMTKCSDCGHRYHVCYHQRSFRGERDVLSLFRGFGVDAIVLVGTSRPIASNLFRTLRYHLMGPSAWSKHAKCPACGTALAETARQRSGPLARVFAGVAWRLRKQEQPRWMIVLLRRSTPEEA